MDITFTCENCHRKLAIDQAGAGITIDCPDCGKPLYVPTPVSEKPIDPPTRVVPKSFPPIAVAPKPVAQKTASVSPAKSGPIQNTTVSPLSRVPKKYSALRAIATILRFLAVPTGLLYLLCAIVIASNGSPIYGSLGIASAIGFVLLGALSVIGLLGASELIRVFIDIEENTCAVRQMMEEEWASKHRPSTPSTSTTAENAGKTSTASSVVRF
jgi:hypothetical protein